MKFLSVTFGRILVVLSLVFLFLKLRQNIGDIKGFTVGFEASLVIILVIGVSVLIGVISAYAWVLFLRGGGFFLSFKRALAIYGQASIAKYIPGNIFHYVGRVTIGSEYGIPKKKVVLSMIAETFIVAVTALTFGVAGLLYEYKSISLFMHSVGGNQLPGTILIVFSVTAILFASSFIFARGREWISLILPYLRSRAVIKTMLLYLFSFLLTGISMHLLLSTLWLVDSTLQWYQFAYGFSLAWVFGYITPGAPGGIGIREVILITLYGQDLGEGIIIGMVLFLRVLMTIGELIIYAIAYYIQKSENLNKGDIRF